MVTAATYMLLAGHTVQAQDADNNQQTTCAEEGKTRLSNFCGNARMNLPQAASIVIQLQMIYLKIAVSLNATRKSSCRQSFMHFSLIN